ncbi:MAG: TrbC/VirB2 family protein [Rhizobiaceae bacterium]|nr:TrbC/VirB2 family protein [Rhizobiaceae bacterium]
MGILKPLLKFGVFGMFVMLAFTSPATAQDLSPITTMLQSIGTALTGPVGRALGLVAIASIGIIFLMGRMNFVYAASVIVGIVILLGAATILSGF